MKYPIALLACLLLAGGCTYETDPLSAQPGTLTAHPPGTFPVVVSAPPPSAPGPGPASAPMAAWSPGAFDGEYRGVVTVERNPGGHCNRSPSVSHWTVAGDRVRFGPYRGRIRPDGSAVLRAGNAYLKGGFTEQGFTGRIWRPGGGCSFAVSLERIV